VGRAIVFLAFIIGINAIFVLHWLWCYVPSLWTDMIKKTVFYKLVLSLIKKAKNKTNKIDSHLQEMLGQ